MNLKNDNSKNRLGLNLFEANLKRHPSVKGLFDEEGNIKTPIDSKDEFLLLNINNNNDNVGLKYIGNDDNKNDSKDQENCNKKETMPVKINRVEEKQVNNKETFFVEMSEEEKREIIKAKAEKKKTMSKFASQPLSYEFNDSQKKFDKDITDAMSKGKEYNEIEDKFKNQLKK